MSKSKTAYESKPHTIGRAIEVMANKAKEDPMQFYIMAEALIKACQMPSTSLVLLSTSGTHGINYSQTPGYEAAVLARNTLFARLDSLTKSADVAEAKVQADAAAVVAEMAVQS